MSIYFDIPFLMITASLVVFVSFIFIPTTFTAFLFNMITDVAQPMQRLLSAHFENRRFND